jgi:uncharacterized protein (DUF4415 family)
MPSLKPGTLHPSPEEAAVIEAAALSDPDAIPLTNEEWEHVKPLVRRGRPRLDAPKEGVFIRLAPEITAAFRATGKGWQTRLNAALVDWLKTHSPGDMAL